MDYKNLFNKLKASPWKKYVYPLISSIVLIVVLSLFLSAVRFLSSNFNKIFLIDQTAIEAQMTKLDQVNFDLAAKKLNIKVSEQAPTPPAQEPAPETQEPESPTPPATTPEILGPAAPTPTPAPAPAPEVKTELKIQVLNSTKTSGLAGTLKTELEQAGFTATTGNSTPVLPATLIKIKAGKKTAYPTSLAEIRQVVDAKYEITEEVLEETNAQDIIIIIGSK